MIHAVISFELITWIKVKYLVTFLSFRVLSEMLMTLVRLRTYSEGLSHKTFAFSRQISHVLCIASIEDIPIASPLHTTTFMNRQFNGSWIASSEQMAHPQRMACLGHGASDPENDPTNAPSTHIPPKRQTLFTCTIQASVALR
jgi:hypothetical protein